MKPRQVVQLLFIASFAVTATVTTGCGSVSAACETLGVCDPPPPPPLVVHVLADPSEGTTVSVTDVSTTLDAALAVIFRRPGSSLHVWVMGNEPAATKEVSPPVVSDIQTSSAPDRVRRQRIDDTVRRLKTQLMDAYAPFFSGKRPRKSPLAESITKIALSDDFREGQRILIVATDGRQVSFVDMECRPPDFTSFSKALHDNDVLQPKVLAGFSIVMTRFELVEVAGNRCPATVSSNRKIEALWRESLAQAGASQALFLAGNPTASVLDSLVSAKQEAASR